MGGNIEKKSATTFQIKTLFLSTAFVAVCVAFARQVFPSMEKLPVVVAIGISGIGGLFVAGFMLVIVGSITIARKPQSTWARALIHSGGYLMAAAFPLAIVFVLVCSVLITVLQK